MQTDHLHQFWTHPYYDVTDSSLLTTLPDETKEKLDTVKSYYVKCIKTIVNQAIVTHQLACEMETNFKAAVFNLDLKFMPKTLKDYDYEWLPTEESLLTYLESHKDKIEEILPKMYTQLQTVSVGLEIIFQNECKNQFNRLKIYLRVVLCEMYTAIQECGLELPEDVQRTVVPVEMRVMTDDAEIKIRNWILLRNFIDIIQCIADVMKMVLAHITNSG